MTAAMRGKPSDRRFRISQMFEKGIVIAGKIARMQDCAAFGAEQKLALVRHVLEPVGKLWNERDSSQALFRLCFMLGNAGFVITEIDGPIDGQRIVRNIFGL